MSINSKQKSRVKALLEQKRHELAEGFNESRARGTQGSADEGGEDYIDYAVSSYTKEFLYSLSDMERTQLLMVDRALRSLEEGTYGTCEECGDEIEEKRLQAVPWAIYCLSCQELSDRGILEPRDGTAGEEE
jgi:DnaK suppressor protein